MEVTTKIKTKTYFTGNLLFPFVFPSKDIRLRFWTVSGEVTSSDKQNADGELYHEFWVRTADGKEEEFKLTNIE